MAKIKENVGDKLKTIYPLFFTRFSCAADGCKHSCCSAGWEIDVDEATAAMYQQLPGALGDELRANLKWQDGVYSLQMQENKSCPFLNEKGLCRLILEIGEEAICDICRYHPRFYTEVDDYELAGTGLCCEVTCEQLLNNEPLLFQVEGEKETYSFPRLLSFLGIKLPAAKLAFLPGTEQADALEILEIMSETEPLDEKWEQELVQYREYALSRPDFLAEYQQVMPKNLFQKIYEYIMYRQLEKLGEFSGEDILNYADISTEYIFLAAAITGDLAEALRRWSEQIEYSPENVVMLLQM